MERVKSKGGLSRIRIHKHVLINFMISRINVKKGDY